MEGRRGIIIVHGDSLLGDDGARINSLIDEMNGAAGDFDPVIEGLLPGFEAGEGRKKGWVDINDAISEGTEEFAFEDPHEAGENDEINLGVLQHGDEPLLSFFVELRAKFSRRDVEGFEIVGFGKVQNAGALNV